MSAQRFATWTRIAHDSPTRRQFLRHVRAPRGCDPLHSVVMVSFVSRGMLELVVLDMPERKARKRKR